MNKLPLYIFSLFRGLYASALCCIVLLIAARVNAQQANPRVDDRVQQYNQRAIRMLNSNKIDSAMPFVDSALKLKENAVSYFLRCHIYAIQKNWDDAIQAGEKAVQFDPSFGQTYADLFFSYTRVGKWHEAQAIADKAVKADPNLAASAESIDMEIDNLNRSRFLIICFLAILGGIFFIPISRSSAKDGSVFTNTTAYRLSEVLLVAITVTCSLWTLFYAFAKTIWSMNPHVATASLTPFIRIFIYEHDGSESFVLYVMMFVGMVGALILTPLLLKTRRSKPLYMGTFAVLLLVSCYYLFNVGFFPPLMHIDARYVYVPIVLSGLAIGLYFLYIKNVRLCRVVVLLLVAFAGLISVAAPSLTDLAYILAPAWRLMHGFKVSEIYFQYDLFLSYLAIAWMKMGLSLPWFEYIGQFSFFLFFAGAFLFADHYFRTRALAAMFIVALVLVRFYCIWADDPAIFQVTPIRLDLWLVLLFVAYKKGVNHWLLGLCLGLLVLFHRNLGLIYLASYAELLVALFLLDILQLIHDKELNGKNVGATIARHFKSNMVNIGIVLGSIALCFIMFREMFSASALIYRKMGVGMLPVVKSSFYWYVFILIISLAVLLYHYRNKLGERYMATALFLVLLVVGESMYFFGRSHENNILNISGILVLALFVLFDVLIYIAPEVVAEDPKGAPLKNKRATSAKTIYLTERRVGLFLPVVFIFFVGYFYSGRISDKIAVQYNNLLEKKVAYSFPPTPVDVPAIKEITHNSPNVYFLDFNYDFYYYYYGNYTPQGFFNPCAAWIYKADLLKLMQDLLDKNYYVVYYSRSNFVDEYIPALKYNKVEEKNGLVAISKENAVTMMPATASSVFHVGMNGNIPLAGMDYVMPSIGADFTIELLMQPVAPQNANAVVLSNLTKVDGLKGFTFQANGNTPGQYVFAFSNGTANLPNTVFMLEDNKWHYVTIVVNKDVLKVYDFGKPVATVNAGGLPFINSEGLLTIGNQASRDAHFNGYIKEVNISNGNMPESDIKKNAEAVAKALPGQ